VTPLYIQRGQLKTEPRRAAGLTELNGGSELARGGHSAFALDLGGVTGAVFREQGCTFGFPKRRGICGAAEQLSPSH
jgi:hypothetical protein